MKLQLLCTFTYMDQLTNCLGNIYRTHTPESITNLKCYMYVDDPNNIICVYNIDGSVKRMKDTISINRKKESSIKSYSAFEDKEIFLKHYSNSFNNYYQKFDGCKSDYVEGLILHNFHGTLHNRQYFELLNIAIKYNFNEDDLCKDENGTLYFTEKGLRMQNEIINYFLNRKEDN